MTHEDDEEFDTKIEPWFVDYITNSIEQYPVISTHGRIIAKITGGRGMEVAETYAYLFAASREMQDALELVIKRMEENHPPKAKRGDLEAVYREAVFYRDLQAARAALKKSYPPHEDRE